MCRTSSFCGASPKTCVGGDCLVVGGFDCWEVFLVDVLASCLLDDL